MPRRASVFCPYALRAQASFVSTFAKSLLRPSCCARIRGRTPIASAPYRPLAAHLVRDAGTQANRFPPGLLFTLKRRSAPARLGPTASASVVIGHVGGFPPDASFIAALAGHGAAGSHYGTGTGALEPHGCGGQLCLGAYANPRPRHPLQAWSRGRACRPRRGVYTRVLFHVSANFVSVFCTTTRQISRFFAKFC